MEIKSVIALVMVFARSSLIVQSLNDKVICPGEAKTEIVQCGHNEIIDINSVTIAYVENWNPCTEEYIVPIIGNLPKTCKSNRKLDVAEVYERCHGELRCSLDGSLIKPLTGLFSCNFLLAVANVVYFNYSCFKVDTSLPNVALPPSDKDVRGQLVQIFSPYYPCSAPLGDYSLTCRITPQKQVPLLILLALRKVDALSSVYFKITRKLVRFPTAGGLCGDHLFFKTNDLRFGDKFHCNDLFLPVEVWNDEIADYTYEHLDLTYKVNPHAGGGKFWMQIEAVENQISIDLQVTCTGQEHIPNLTTLCSPISDVIISKTTRATTTIPTTTTTTTTAATTFKTTTTASVVATLYTTTTTSAPIEPHDQPDSKPNHPSTTTTTATKMETSTTTTMDGIKNRQSGGASMKSSSGSMGRLVAGLVVTAILIISILVAIFVWRYWSAKKKPEDCEHIEYYAQDNSPQSAEVHYAVAPGYVDMRLGRTRNGHATQNRHPAAVGNAHANTAGNGTDVSHSHADVRNLPDVDETYSIPFTVPDGYDVPPLARPVKINGESADDYEEIPPGKAPLPPKRQKVYKGALSADKVQTGHDNTRRKSNA